MKYLDMERLIGQPSAPPSDPRTVSTLLAAQLGELEDALSALPTDTPLSERNRLQLQCGYTLLDLGRNPEAWQRTRPLLEPTVAAENWLQAVEICDILYRSEQHESLKALAHGVWLGVTYPIDPELSVAMLQHIVEETPDHSDGGAVAAAVANYLVDLRASGEQRETLHFFTTQLLGEVARRHSQVEEKEIFDFWVEQLALNDPAKLLPHLAKMLDLLVTDGWWFDRDQLRSRIPEA